MKIARLLLLGLAHVAAVSCGDSESVGPELSVASIRLSPENPTTTVGLTVQFEAEVRNTSGETLVDAPVEWSTSAGGIASISDTGLAAAHGVGNTVITASVGGVKATQVLTVEPDPCEERIEVAMSVGEHRLYAADDCLLLPSGSPGERYRIAVARPTLVENPNDVVTATLDVNPIGVVAEAPPPSPAPEATAVPRAPTIDATPFLPALERRARNRAAHLELRARELALDFGPGSALPSRPAAAPPMLADPPDRHTFFTGATCTSSDTITAQPAVLIHFNTDIAVYQDSAEHETTPISVTTAERLADYYTAYVRDLTATYWGALPDVDGNGRLLVTTSAKLPEGSAAAVFSGDLLPTSACQTSNQAEVVYFDVQTLRRMEDPMTAVYSALPTLAHEVKHIVSLYNRNAAGNREQSAQFHPSWIEEGQAEIAAEMASRVAWAATGGPPVGQRITATDIYGIEGRLQTSEAWGVIENLLALMFQVGTHPNSILVDPQGASEFHSFYAGSWHFHRFLADAYFGASTAFGDAPSFRALNDSLAPRGVTGLELQTGQTFEQLFEDFVAAVSVHGTGAPPAPRAFSTFDFVSATDIFSFDPQAGVPELPGDYPWPVTAVQEEDEGAPYARHTFAGQIGPSGVRFYDFVSPGTGVEALVTVQVASPAWVMVTRLR